MAQTIYIATNNKHKVQEIASALEALLPGHYSIRPCGEILKEAIDWQETGTTFRENAAIKARALREHTRENVLADDSGLCVDALGGAPGVFSSRYGGPGASDKSNYELLLANLKEVPESERTARFVCGLCFIDRDGQEIYAEGTCEGSILLSPSGHGGFGYDPVFRVADGRTMASLSEAEKNALSHRGRALHKLAPLIGDDSRQASKNRNRNNDY